MALLGRAKQVYESEGLTCLLRRGCAYVLSFLFQRRSYWLYEHTLESLRGVSEADFMPRIDAFDLKVVSSNHEADQLEVEGFEFRSKVVNARKALGHGATAFCVFVRHELVNIGWVALCQEAKDALREPPYHVDFAGKEACGGAAWTHPGYRRKRLRLYNRYKRLQFLLEQGVATNRSAIAKNNTAALEGYKRFPPTRTHAEGRYLRILWWKWWKETPLAIEETRTE